MSVTKQGMDSIDFFSYYGSQWGPSTVSDILQNIFFCVQQKKEILTGLKQLEGE